MVVWNVKPGHLLLVSSKTNHFYCKKEVLTIIFLLQVFFNDIFPTGKNHYLKNNL